MSSDVLTLNGLSQTELEAVAACVRSGVEVLASAHFRDIESMRASPPFARALRERIFGYYILLSREGIGRVAGIYGADLSPVAVC